MADAALGDHGLDFAVQGVGEHVAELHFEARGVADEGRREEDLVGGAEVEGEGVGVHEFAVLLAAFAAHGGLGYGGCWLGVFLGAFDGWVEGW